MAPAASSTTDKKSTSSISKGSSFEEEKWCIDIDILLKQGKDNDREGLVMTSKRYRNGRHPEDQILIPLNRHRAHQGWVHCGYKAGCVLENIGYERTQLNDRVAIYVGDDEIAVELPSIILTQCSIFFRSAFGSREGTMFAEGVNKSMKLPEVDVEVFMVLIRSLVHQAPSLCAIDKPAWPFPCPICEESDCSPGGHVSISVKQPTEEPISMRVCALLDKLGFELSYNALQGIHGPMHSCAGLLLSPDMIEAAMKTSLDGGYVQQYIAKLLVKILRDTSLASFKTYNALLKRYPHLTIAVLESMSGDQTGDWEWDEKAGAWDKTKANPW